MEDQDRIETEDTDVEGHKLADKVSHGAADEPKGEEESDEPDVEGHKLSQKISQKFSH